MAARTLTIAFDVMGSDLGPAEVVRGAARLSLEASGGIQRLKSVTDWEQYGGAPVLDFDKVFIKAHGRSRARAIANAGKVAAKAVAADLGRAVQEGLSA